MIGKTNGKWHIPPVLYAAFAVNGIAAAIIIAISLARVGSHTTQPVDTTIECRRIVSMSPNITETLFALGLGDRVVGVTTFCKYPLEARTKRSVGGYLDPNYEVIMALKPDMVFLLPEQVQVAEMLRSLTIPCTVIGNRTVAEILDTIRMIGKTCGVEQRGNVLADSLETRMQSIRNRTDRLTHPRVLISVSRDLDAGVIQRVYAAGPGTFFDELIGFAGGVNAYNGPPVAYPVLSTEGLLTINPDIIIDLVIPGMLSKTSPENILAEWKGLSRIEAVKNNHVYVLDTDYATIPGPRFIRLLEDLASIIHSQGTGNSQ